MTRYALKAADGTWLSGLAVGHLSNDGEIEVVWAEYHGSAYTSVSQQELKAISSLVPNGDKHPLSVRKWVPE